jgi:hypothetical protein
MTDEGWVTEWESPHFRVQRYWRETCQDVSYRLQEKVVSTLAGQNRLIWGNVAIAQRFLIEWMEGGR